MEPLIPVEEMPPYVQIIPLAMTTPASWLEKDPENVNFSPEEDRSGPFTIAAVVRASGTIDELERHEKILSLENKVVKVNKIEFIKRKKSTEEVLSIN